MFEYLNPYDGPVVAGLEHAETVYAKDQPEYIPLRTLPGEHGLSAISRWHPTFEQREAIANGADILLEVTHFGQPLSPVRVMVADQCSLGEWFPAFFSGMTLGDYPLEPRDA